MFELQTYLAKSPRLVELECWGEAEKFAKIERYLDIDNPYISNIISCKKFNLRYCSMVITIQYNGQYIVDFDSPKASGGGLWLDYLTCLEQYTVNGLSSTSYGIDYYRMSMIKLGSNEVTFSVYLDYEQEEVLSVILPEAAFFQALITELRRIWSLFNDFGLFDKITSSKEIGLGEKILKRIEKVEQVLESKPIHDRPRDFYESEME